MTSKMMWMKKMKKKMTTTFAGPVKNVDLSEMVAMVAAKMKLLNFWWS